MFFKETKTGNIIVKKEAISHNQYCQVYYNVAIKYNKMMKAIIDNPQLFKDATTDTISAMTNTKFDSYDEFDELINYLKIYNKQ